MVMKMYKINIADFRNKVTIQRYTTVVNDDGIPNEKYTDLITINAKVQNTTGKEFQQSYGTTASVTTKFTIRYLRNLNLTSKDRIIYNGNAYNIVYVNNISEANTYLELVGVLNG